MGIPSQVFRPGVLVPEVVHRGVAERAGLQRGDLVTYINAPQGAPARLPASPASVTQLVDTIKCGLHNISDGCEIARFGGGLIGEQALRLFASAAAGAQLVDTISCSSTPT